MMILIRRRRRRISAGAQIDKMTPSTARHQASRMTKMQAAYLPYKIHCAKGRCDQRAYIYIYIYIYI